LALGFSSFGFSSAFFSGFGFFSFFGFSGPGGGFGMSCSSIPDGLPLLDFHVTCSKGTYIRSLARDFGLALGSGAFLSALRRERIGDHTISEAINLEDIEEKITLNTLNIDC
jgi:tRNA U55 pseudouridine synthase TruB